MNSAFRKILLYLIFITSILLVVYFINNIYQKKQKEIVFQQDNYVLKVDEMIMLKLKDSSNRKYVWSSSNNNVAIVSENGFVTALAKGFASITASSGSKKTECMIEVIEKGNSNPIINVEKVQFTDKEINMIIGEKRTIQYEVTPQDANKEGIKVISSDNSIININNMVIEGLKEGTATLTIESKNEKKDTCKVTVKKPIILPTSVKINSVKDGLKLGETLNLKYNYTPVDATNNLITFESSNANVATVDNTGKVIGKSLGETKISAKVNGKELSNVLVKVIPNVNIIPIHNQKARVIKDGLIFKTPDGSRTNIQDFDILNIGTDNEEYYFTCPYKSGLFNTTLVPNHDEMVKLQTIIVYKLKKNQLNDTSSGSMMFVKKAGQGQWIIKEPGNNYFWTSGNSRVICSGKGCNYNDANGFVCTDASQCTWWGGNNANVQRLNFKVNNYGDDIITNIYYNFGTIMQKSISVFMAYDDTNDLMALFIHKGTNLNCEVYKASDYKCGKRTLIYSFPVNKGLNMSVQGYAMNGGYIYKLRGDSIVGLYIEVINMYGEIISTQLISTGYREKAEEGQGIKIHNNRIYFGIFYRPTCDWDETNRKCKKTVAVSSAILYLQ